MFDGFKKFFGKVNNNSKNNPKISPEERKNGQPPVKDDMEGITFEVTSSTSDTNNTDKNLETNVIESKNNILENENPVERLSEVQEKIVNHKLNPADTKGLNPISLENAKKVEDAAAQNLGEVKDESLNNLKEAKKLIFTAGAVDATDIVRSRSYSAASEAMTVGKEELKGFKGVLKKIWKYNYLEKVYHQTERIKAKENILKSGNIFANENLNETEKESADKETKQNILQRFTADIKDELVEEKLGESREELRADTILEKKIKADLKTIINDYADGKIDEAQFEDKKRKIFVELDERKRQDAIANKNEKAKNKYEKTELYIDNFLEIADKVKEIKNNIRQAQDHQGKLAQFDFEINLVLGKAKEGIKTENHYNLVDKTIENLGKTRLGSMVNETTLAVGVGLAASVGSFFSQKIARSKALAIGTLGASALVSGVFMGAKENMMQKRERQTLERRDALNEKTESRPEDEKRKEEVAKQIAELEATKKITSNKKTLKSINSELKKLTKEQEKLQGTDKFIYEKEKSTKLFQELSAALYEKDSQGEKKYKELATEEDVEKLLNTLADIEARLEISNNKKIDLISYSGIAKVETERTDLLILKAEARKRLKEISDDKRDYTCYLEQLRDIHLTELLTGKDGKGGIEKKDQEFNKYKNIAIIKKVTAGVLTGLAVGATVQETAAFFSSEQEGFVENLLKGHDQVLGAKDTLLQYLFGHHAEIFHEVVVENGTVKIPDGCEFIKDATGSYNLQRGSEILASHLAIDGNGAFTEESKNILAENGINLSASGHLVETGQTVMTGTNSSPEDYLNKHSENVKEISRGLWYGNDTPMYVGEDGKLHGADLNELRAHWGGDNGTGINAKTDSYEMSAFKMTPDGSFQTVGGIKLNEDATALIKEGKMKFLFSLSSGTQNKVIEIPIDPATGKISVPRDGELGKLLFGEKNGQTFLKVKFAEVATSAGVGKDGIEKVHIFATAVGEGLKEVDSSVVTEVPPITNTASILNVPRDIVTPLIIPVTGRKPLEKSKKHEAEGLIPAYYYKTLNQEEKYQAKNNFSEKLKNNPDADLDQYEVISEYLAKQDKNYLETLNKLADSAGPMGDECRLSVCIPVAGHQESNVIYKTLENYLNQDADKNSFEITLLVNRPEIGKNNEAISSEETLKEIERFKKDHPELKVRLMDIIIPNEKALIGNIRKILNDAVLMRQQKRGKEANDLLIVSNDADNKGMSSEYISNFIDKFDKNKNADAMLGQLDWDPESYVRNPLVHIGTRLFQYIEMVVRQNDKKIVGSSGANFAFRASIYAGVNGYDEGADLAEDVALGNKIKLAREDSPSRLGIIFAGILKSRMYTSSRRAEQALTKGLAPYEQWNQIFSAFDDEVRKIKWENKSQAPDLKDGKVVKELMENMEVVINRTLMAQSQWSGFDQKIFDRAMGWLGIKFIYLSDGKIKITDYSRLLKGLQKYSSDGLKLFKQKKAPKIRTTSSKK